MPRRPRDTGPPDAETSTSPAPVGNSATSARGVAWATGEVLNVSLIRLSSRSIAHFPEPSESSSSPRCTRTESASTRMFAQTGSFSDAAAPAERNSGRQGGTQNVEVWKQRRERRRRVLLRDVRRTPLLRGSSRLRLRRLVRRQRRHDFRRFRLWSQGPDNRGRRKRPVAHGCRATLKARTPVTRFQREPPHRTLERSQSHLDSIRLTPHAEASRHLDAPPSSPSILSESKARSTATEPLLARPVGRALRLRQASTADRRLPASRAARRPLLAATRFGCR